MHDFSWGVANRGCSIRVGRLVPVEKCGYYEVCGCCNQWQAPYLCMHAV